MSSTAANRVFAVPELLENILLHMTPEMEEDDYPSSFPVKSLFQLLRVSKTFQGTIEGSIKLQRLMFLAPLEQKSTEPCINDQFGPLIWIISTLADKFDTHYKKEPQQAGVFLCPVFTHDDEEYDENYRSFSRKLQKFQRGGYGRPEASWRQMRMLSSPDCKIIFHFFVSLGNNSEGQTSNVRWSFDAGEKLEAFYQKWKALMESLKREVAKFDKLNTQCAKVDLEIVAGRRREDAKIAAHGCVNLASVVD